jgi:hypothetical protein
MDAPQADGLIAHREAHLWTGIQKRVIPVRISRKEGHRFTA